MTFEFSDKDQTLKIYNYDDDGVFLLSTDFFVKVGTGLPAKSTTTAYDSDTELEDNQVWVYSPDDDIWTVAYDNRGKTYWTDYQTSQTITQLGETLPDGATWKQPDKPEDIIQAEKSLTERTWRDTVLNSVLDRIDQYEKDQNYADEYKTSSLTAEEYTSLLSDRKRLCDYPDTDGFPDVDRPELSGIVA